MRTRTALIVSLGALTGAAGLQTKWDGPPVGGFDIVETASARMWRGIGGSLESDRSEQFSSTPAQLDPGDGSRRRSHFRGVTTHRPNELALKMDGAQACYPYLAAGVETMPRRVGRRGGQ